jgi:hypothetical protein
VKNNIEKIITEEIQKLIGYVMPIIEVSINEQQKSGIKKCLWKLKDNLSEKLISEKNEKFYNTYR